jgi:hypothetical protein
LAEPSPNRNGRRPGALKPSLDVYAATLNPTTLAESGTARLTSFTSNPNWDQFSGRTVPFAGDSLWIDSAGGRTFATWTDYRNTVAGNDPRTTGTRGDVKQCRTQWGTAATPATPAPAWAGSTRTSTATWRRDRWPSPSAGSRSGSHHASLSPTAELICSAHQKNGESAV